MPIALLGLWYNVTFDWTDAAGGSDSQTSFGVLADNIADDPADILTEAVLAAVDNIWWPADVALEVASITNGFTANSFASGVAGAAGTSLPFNSAILVRKTVPTLPQRRWGRNFYPGAQPAGVNVSGNLTSGYQSDLQANFDGFLTDLEGSAHIANMIQFTAPATGGGARDYELVTALNVTGKVGTLRRRIRR
jgi:hypothetical protein